MTVQTQEHTTKEMAPREKQEVTGAESTRPGPMFTPAVDILETEGAITVLADLPGVRPEGLSIDLRDNVLTLEGRITAERREGEQMLLREYRTGSYRREFQLTNLIDQAKIDARLTDGVLRLTLPKAEAAKPRRIEVRTG